MSIEKTLINNIIKNITEAVKVKEIILFGSYAKGIANENSDIDLCILIENGNYEMRELKRKIRERIRDAGNYKLPLDILVYTEEEFQRMSKINIALESEIKATGVVIYG